MHLAGTQLQGSIKPNLLSDMRALGSHKSSKIFSLTLEDLFNLLFISFLLVIKVHTIISCLDSRPTWQMDWFTQFGAAYFGRKKKKVHCLKE